MRVVDSRRLRGPNLQTREPAAIAEVALEEGETAVACEKAWRGEVGRLGKALGWKAKPVVRRFAGGLALVLPAPVDALMEATEVNELAVRAATDAMAGRPTADYDATAADLRARVEAGRNPALLALRAEAIRRDIPFLWDDDTLTLGMAAHSQTYALGELPSPEQVPWKRLRRIPVALVTGTNGKTTTARLLARMVTLAGKVPGNTSTDGVSVGEEVVEEGDWTGPEAARLVLRRSDVDVAILETARGGILRRGLAVDACDVALVTNVTSDHLGEFGVQDLPTMARAKGVVGTVARGRVVIGDDPLLVELSPTFTAPVVLVALSADSPTARAHLAKGGEVFTEDGGSFVRIAAGKRTGLGRVDEAPLTFGGVARHNVANALSAAAVAYGLGLPVRAIKSALRTFGSKPGDNPGRGQLVEAPGGKRVLLDFGHNPAGLRELLHLAASLTGEGGRIVSVHTQPGDRTAEDTRLVAAEIAGAHPRVVVLWESEEYRRGREPGDIVAALRGALVSAGMSASHVLDAELETEALAKALAAAKPADIVVVAPHVERAAVARMLTES
jgi:UDP-N-acetylmuramyl tripeptide synthase